jgi:hypothetical protein
MTKKMTSMIEMQRMERIGTCTYVCHKCSIHLTLAPYKTTHSSSLSLSQGTATLA